MKPVCFFAGWPGACPCDGALIRAHLLPRQLLKREFPRGVVADESGGRWRRLARGEDVRGRDHRSLENLCRDPRGWVPCCGGPMGPGGHHGMLDQSRTLRIPRAKLPPAVEEFAAQLGLGWWLDREYGEVACRCGGRAWEDAEDGGRCVNCGVPHPNMAEAVS